MKKILIVGISARAMAESAIHSNYPIVALDAFGDRDLKAIAESYSLHHDYHTLYSPDALYQASRQLSFDAAAYTSNLENYPEILRRICRSSIIIGNSPPSIESVRRWSDLFSRLQRSGFPVPETILGDAGKADRNRRWLIKPILSGGGHGIAFFQGNNPPGKQNMLQEYIPGKPCSASFIANGRDCTVIGIAEQLIGMSPFGSHGFRYCGNLLPLQETLDPKAGNNILEQTRRLAAFLTQEYGLTGVNGIDFILHDDQIYLTEVNPRYSASMELIERAYRLPIFRLHTQAVLDGKLPEFRLENFLISRECFGKAILFAESDAVAPDTQNWRSRAIRDIPAPGEILHKGGPICTILAKRPSYNETFAELIHQAGKLKKEIYDKTIS